MHRVHVHCGELWGYIMTHRMALKRTSTDRCEWALALWCKDKSSVGDSFTDMLSENTDVGWDALRAGSCKAAQTTQWLRRDFKDLFIAVRNTAKMWCCNCNFKLCVGYKTWSGWCRLKHLFWLVFLYFVSPISYPHFNQSVFHNPVLFQTLGRS